MKTRILATSLAASLSLSLTLNACLLDDKKDIPKTAAGNYVVAISTSAANGTDYIMTVSSLDSGIISANGRGIEQTGYRHMHAFQNLFFSVGYQADNHLIAYRKDQTDTALVEKGRFAFPATMDLLSEVSSTEAVGLEMPRTGLLPRTLFRISLDPTVSIADRDSLRIHEITHDSMTVWGTGLIHRDGKLFLSYYHVHGRGDFVPFDNKDTAAKYTDTSYVAVFEYPSLDFVKVIKDPRGGAIGLYANKNGLIKTASNDIYSYTCASRVCHTSDTTVKHSKILRIKNGQTEWDQTYEFDFEAATGKKLVWFTHAGGEMALGRVMDPAPGEAAGTLGPGTSRWAAIGAGPVQLYVIDLANKTAAPVTGVPAHRGAQRMASYTANGKVYVSTITTATAETPSEHALYAVDIAAKTGTKGATIAGSAVRLIAR